MDPGDDPGDGTPADDGLVTELEKRLPEYMTFTVTTYNCTICPGSDTDSARGFLTKDGYIQHMLKDHKDWKKHYQQRFGGLAPGPPPAPDSDSAISSSSSSSDQEVEEESPIEDESDDDDTDDDDNEGMEIEENPEAEEQDDATNNTNISDNQVTSTTNHDTIIQEEDINEGLKSKITNETIELEGLVLTERNEIGLTSPTTSNAETLVSTDENSNDGDGSEMKTPEKKETESKEAPPQSQSNECNDDNKEKNDEKIEIKKDNDATSCDDINCSICSKNFATEEDLQEHYEEDHDEEQVCGQCTKVFPTGLSLYKHEKVHFKFPCSICEWRFRNKERLDQHWPIHFGSSNVFDSNRRRREEKLITFFNCPDNVCKRVFDSDRSLKLHVAKMHPELKSPTNTPPKKKRRTSSNNSQSSSTTSTSKSSASMRATSPTNSNASMSLSSVSQKSSRSTPKNRKNKNIKAKGIVCTPTPATEINTPPPKKPKLLSLTSHFDSSDDEESSSEKAVKKSKSATKHQTQKTVSAVLSTLQRQKSQSANANTNTETVQKESREQEVHSKSTPIPTYTSEILTTSTSTSTANKTSNSNDKLMITTTTQTPVITTTTSSTMGMSSALINLYTELDRQKLTNKPKTSIPKPPVKVPAAFLNLKFGSSARPIVKTVPPVTSSSFSWPQKTPAPTPTTQGQDQGKEPGTLATGNGKTQDNLKNQTENDTTTTTKDQNEKDATTKKTSKAVSAALLNLKFGPSSRPSDKTVPPVTVTSSSLELELKTPTPSPAANKEPSNPSTLTLASNLKDKDQDNSKNLNEKDTTAKRVSKVPPAVLSNLNFGPVSRPLAEGQPPVTNSSSSLEQNLNPLKLIGTPSPAKEPSNPSTFTLASKLQDKDKDNSKNQNEKYTTTKEPSNPSTVTLASKLQDNDNSNNQNEKYTTTKEPSNPSTVTMASKLPDKDKDNSKNQNEKDTTTNKKISKAVPAVLSNLGFGSLSRPLDKTVPPMTMPVTTSSTYSTFPLTQKISTPTIIPTTESSNTLTLTTNIQDNSNQNKNEKDTDTDTATATANVSFTCKTGAGTETNNSPNILLQQSQHQLIVDCDDNDGPRSTDHSFQNAYEIVSKSTDINARLSELALLSVKGTSTGQKNSSSDPNPSLFQAFQSQTQRIVDDNDGPRSANSLQNAHESKSKDIKARLIELALSNVNEKKSVQSPIGDQKRKNRTRWDTTDYEQNCNRFQVQGQHQYQSQPRNQFCPRPRPVPLFSLRLYRPYTGTGDNWRGHFSPDQVQSKGFTSPRFDYRFQTNPASTLSQQRQRHQTPVQGFRPRGPTGFLSNPVSLNSPQQRHQSPVQGLESPTVHRFQSNLSLNMSQQRHQGPSQGIKSSEVNEFPTNPGQIKNPEVIYQLPANLAQGIKSPSVIYQLPVNFAQGIESPAVNQFPTNPGQIKSPEVIQFPTNSGQIKNPEVIQFPTNPGQIKSPEVNQFQTNTGQIQIESPAVIHQFRAPTGFHTNPVSNSNSPQQRQHHQSPVQGLKSPTAQHRFQSNTALSLPQQRHQGPSQGIESSAVIYQLPANLAQEIKNPSVNQFPTNPGQIKNPAFNQFPTNPGQIKSPEVIQFPTNPGQIKSPEVNQFQTNSGQIKNPEVIQFQTKNPGQIKSPEVNQFQTNPGQIKSSAVNQFQTNPGQIKSPSVIYQLLANLAQGIKNPSVIYQLPVPANFAQGIKSPEVIQFPTNPGQIKSSAVNQFPTNPGQIKSSAVNQFQTNPGQIENPAVNQFQTNPGQIKSSEVIQFQTNPGQIKSPSVIYQLPANLAQGIKSPSVNQFPTNPGQIKSQEVIQFQTNPGQIKNPEVIQFQPNPVSNSNSLQQCQRHQSPVQGLESPTAQHRFQSNSALSLPQQRHQSPSQENKSPAAGVIHQFPTNPAPILNSPPPQSPNHNNVDVDPDETTGNNDNFYIDYNHGQQIRFSSDFHDFSK